ncbi:MAG: ABC transporter permease, partial [Burkholderiales bacterium]|nr:ABC transporter permease [Burkholderiales bacterium]
LLIANTRTTFREFNNLLENPGEIVFCLIMPLVWMLVIWGLLGRGIITEVPVAFVDNDNTPMSRKIASALDANRAIGLVSFNSQPEAMDSMKDGSTYGVIVIPFGYMKDMLSGRGSSVTIYLDENRYSIAGTLQGEIATLASTLSLQNSAQAFLQKGSGPANAERLVSIVHPGFNAIGNEAFNFNPFLGSTLLPGVLMVGAMFCFVTCIIREDFQNTISEWFKCADGSITAAVIGKLTPYWVAYAIFWLFYFALFCGFGGWTPTGSLFLWFIIGLMCLNAFACVAVLIAGLAPTWRFTLIIASGYAAPALPFTGFSIPIDSMGPVLQFFCKLLPLTWYIEGQSRIWMLGAHIYDLEDVFKGLFLIAIIPFIFGLPLLKFVYTRRATKREAKRLALATAEVAKP